MKLAGNNELYFSEEAMIQAMEYFLEYKLAIANSVMSVKVSDSAKNRFVVKLHPPIIPTSAN